MKRVNYNIFIIIIVALLLPNCGRVYDWAKGNFYQGESLAVPYEAIKPCIQSVTVYDEFETKAHFDVMWLSDTIRTHYAQLHINRLGKNEEHYEAFLRRQLEENSYYIAFYILTTHDVKLGVPESAWTFYLRIDNTDYQPLEFKEIELPYEYQIFFGKLWNRFKVPYLLRFRLEQADENPIMLEGIRKIDLYVRSAFKEHVFSWYLDSPCTFKPVDTFSQTEQKKAAPIQQPKKSRR